MDAILILIWFIIKLPIHIYHTVTFGKYNKDETEQSLYNAAAILIVVFSILAVFVKLILILKK